ncbi:N-acetylmuramoyl-L-alanine amidase [uncultured Tenacibaculum sp.]|uniref:N-acetylmuramoyl-L-alanine amidase family protein n=1 Tax=uncultured Tenacibaculum sp. TaxID=174713 RepID=UPI0026399D02|nr:N-acetylmuramoyl-L-alanine amidase [uncultured Tenacibaculum sp.]
MQFLKLPKYNLRKKTLLFLILFFISISFNTEVYAQKKYTVVLDAGHGGKDSGNIGNGYREKKIALRVALDVGKELLTAKDVNVVYTRKTDVFVELHNRAKIANTKKADLFVSIHCDAFTKEHPHGASTFVLGLNGNKENLEISKRENAVILLEDNYKQNYNYDPNSPESVIGLSVLQEGNLDNSLNIAGMIQDNFVSLRRNNRRVKQANFLVLRETVMPSVLVELGFLTNVKEGRFLNTRSGQIKMAKAIAEAIKKYINVLKLNRVRDNSSSVNTIAETPKKKETPKVTPKKVVQKPKSVKKDTKVVTKKVVTKAPEKKPVKKLSTKIIAKKPSSKVEFRVQIAASRKFISEKNFKNLKNVKYLIIDDYYKYFYGSSGSLAGIKKHLATARSVGYKDAWIVAFKNGKKISIKEALKNQ